MGWTPYLRKLASSRLKKAGSIADGLNPSPALLAGEGDGGGKRRGPNWVDR